MSPNPAEALQRRLAEDPAMRKVVGILLDRCDLRGSLPGTFTLACSNAEEEHAAIRLLSAAAVRRAPSRGTHVIRLDLARARERMLSEGGTDLAQVLYAAARRAPRNLAAESAALAAMAARVALEAIETHVESSVAADYLRAEAARLGQARGEMFEIARRYGLDALRSEVALTARSIALAAANDAPVRLANFARKATGSTKGLRAGDRRYVRVFDALLRHAPGLAERVAAEGPLEPAARRRIAAECVGIFRNETPIDVLCFGRFVLQKEGRRFDAPAAHHAIGEPCKLLLIHLRGAKVDGIEAERVVTIENETTFNDYVDELAIHGGKEIVVWTGGQANWAVVRLLVLLAQAAPGLPIVHWGDLDRHGVLILRSLRARSRLSIEPLWMDPQTLRRVAASGVPFDDAERAEIAALAASSPGDVCVDLLESLLEMGCRVEQESVADLVLGVFHARDRSASGDAALVHRSPADRS